MSTTETVLEINNLLTRQQLVTDVVSKWDSWNTQRRGWLNEKQELRKFLFATDTSTTSVGALDWKNRTTLPKLCQIRDNLHANYLSALFPNDEWLVWEGYTTKDEEKKKKVAIQAYMANKARESGLRETASELLYDYIDYGIAISDTVWINEKKLDPDDGGLIPNYVGPKAIRRSPLDVVFDPTAPSFKDSVKITRSIISIGELLKRAESGEEWYKDALAVAKNNRSKFLAYNKDDFDKADAFSVDGFGTYQEYLGSGNVELLELEGTVHSLEDDEILDDYIITIIDRHTIVRKEPIPAWKRGGMKVAASWRKRPDNLYAMGPLDNLVGMQYRIDHLQNAKSDAWDLIVNPMFKIKGSVQEFEFRPGGEVQMDTDADVTPFIVPDAALMASSEIEFMMSLMEEFAGAPKQAMGVRTPGEKTAFEVQALENAAGRIFQEKITQFEVELLEPTLNNMLLVAVKNFNVSDTVRVMDDVVGVSTFLEIKKEDITATGKLRPIGARHFAHRAQLIQNLTGISNTPIWAKIQHHVGDKVLARLVEDSLQLHRFQLISDNAALFDQADTQRIAQTLQDEVGVEAATPVA